MYHKDKIKNMITYIKNTHSYENGAYTVVRMENI